MSFRIWIDADSCPRQIREIICRAAIRREITACFVANRQLPLPEDPYLTMQVVGLEEGAADKYLCEQVTASDIAVTRDIPLAHNLVGLGAVVLDDRGKAYTSQNIGERLSMRNFMKHLRDSGLEFEKHAPLSQKEVLAFANAFDRELTSRIREQNA